MWKVLLGAFGFIFIVVLIIAFENLNTATYFMFLFKQVNKSLFYVIMYMFFFGTVAGILLGMIPFVLTRGNKSGPDAGPDDIDL